VNGVGLAYELIGTGEPLLLIHGSNFATGLLPLADALAQRAPWLRLLRYHRRGYGTIAGGSIPVDQHASDALELLTSLAMPSAHLLGYSYGGVVALQAAMMAPTRVRSLVLIEPILTEVPSAANFQAAMDPVMSRYADGDMAGAVAATFASLGGQGWKALIATAGPDALAMAVRDTPTFYQAEAPSLNNWTLDPARTTAVHGPVLSVRGGDSGQFFTEGRQLLHQRFAHCVDADIPDANHLLYLQAPKAIANAVAGFIPRRQE
jgi:pimeloyl-ACP methyl ester carboxylesterase